MADAYLGQVMITAAQWVPNNWMPCDGRSLEIRQFTALFSLLGTAYGGNGTVTFNLPDLRGRVPLSAGQGPNLSSYSIGQSGGAETVSLTTQQLAAHSHIVTGDNSAATTASPGNANLAMPGNRQTPGPSIYTTGSPSSPAQFNNNMIGSSGLGQGHPNLQPYLALTWIICVQGLFPSRN